MAAVVFLPLSLSGWPIAAAACKALPFMFAAMFAFASNDLCDIEKDRISKPHRALPSGVLSRRAAQIVTAFILILSIVVSCAFASTLFEGAIYGITIAGAAMYNFVVKKAAAAKAFVTALISMMPFVFVSALLQNPQGVWSIALILFFYISSRELKMDIRDEEGDRKAGISTLAIRLGESKCLRLSYCLLFVSVVLYLVAIDLYDPVALAAFALFLGVQLAIEFAWKFGKETARRYSILAQWIPMAIVFFSLVW